MKANTNITNKNRTLSTLAILIFAVTIGYGQGLLAESAMRLFKTNKSVVEVNVPEYTFASYTEDSKLTEDSFSLKNYFRDITKRDLDFNSGKNQIDEVHISKTIYTSAVAVSYESDIETEEWMTVSLVESFEEEITIEDWMTVSLAESFEEEIAIESWMTESLTASIETEINTEDWMTESFTAYTEETISVENWMTQAFSAK